MAIWVVSLLTAKLIPRGLTPEIVAAVFGVWLGRVPREGPLDNSVSLPPQRSGSRLALRFRVYRPQLNALFRLGFPMASSRKDLTALQTITRRIIIQKARRRPLNRAPTACKRMVSGSFPPLKGVLFIFRSLYCALSVVGEYLALRDGPRRFSQGFT